MKNLLATYRQHFDGAITSEREKKPAARLEAIHPVARKRLGALETPGFVITDAFYEPLPQEELRLWNGEGE
jgi:hypothetical protein